MVQHYYTNIHVIIGLPWEPMATYVLIMRAAWVAASPMISSVVISPSAITGGLDLSKNRHQTQNQRPCYVLLRTEDMLFSSGQPLDMTSMDTFHSSTP